MSSAMLLTDDLPLTDDDREVEPERLPEHFEVINGQIVETPYMSNYANAVAGRLEHTVIRYLMSHDLGETGKELLFHIPLPEDPGRNRKPDLAFVSYERWAKDRPYSPRGSAWDVVPDIAAEVVSPGDFAEDLLRKVREYIRGGVRLVWVVYPLAREIHAYWPGATSVRVYAAEDDLDAGDVLPEFRTRVGDLFPPVESPPPPPISG
jgi:Uma2 family endonuclease